MFLGINLALETYSLGLINEGKLISEINLDAERAFSEDLILEIDALLSRKSLSVSDLKAIGIVNGPGSYTGLRIATVVAKTLAMLQKIPVYGFSTLETIAASFQGFDGVYFPIVKAMAGEVNAATFAVNNQEIKRITPDFVVNLETLLKNISQIKELVYVVDLSKKEELVRSFFPESSKVRIINDFYLRAFVIAMMAEASYLQGLPGNYQDLMPKYSYQAIRK